MLRTQFLEELMQDTNQMTETKIIIGHQAFYLMKLS